MPRSVRSLLWLFPFVAFSGCLNETNTDVVSTKTVDLPTRRFQLYTPPSARVAEPLAKLAPPSPALVVEQRETFVPTPLNLVQERDTEAPVFENESYFRTPVLETRLADAGGYDTRPSDSNDTFESTPASTPKTFSPSSFNNSASSSATPAAQTVAANTSATTTASASSTTTATPQQFQGRVGSSSPEARALSAFELRQQSLASFAMSVRAARSVSISGGHKDGDAVLVCAESNEEFDVPTEDGNFVFTSASCTLSMGHREDDSVRILNEEELRVRFPTEKFSSPDFMMAMCYFITDKDKMRIRMCNDYPALLQPDGSNPAKLVFFYPVSEVKNIVDAKMLVLDGMVIPLGSSHSRKIVLMQ